MSEVNSSHDYRWHHKNQQIVLAGAFEAIDGPDPVFREREEGVCRGAEQIYAMRSCDDATRGLRWTLSRHQQAPGLANLSSLVVASLLAWPVACLECFHRPDCDPAFC